MNKQTNLVEPANGFFVASPYAQPRREAKAAGAKTTSATADSGAAQLNCDFFYRWIGEECYLSPGVSGSVQRLWAAYARSASRVELHVERDAFMQAVATEFVVRDGLVAGLCMDVDAKAFACAYLG